MSRRVIWSAIWFVLPWLVGTFLFSVAKLSFFGPLQWDEFGRAMAAYLSLALAAACWFFPGWSDRW